MILDEKLRKMHGYTRNTAESRGMILDEKLRKMHGYTRNRVARDDM